jgi:sodium/potassium-transporting ATPase subunit alpha
MSENKNECGDVFVSLDASTLEPCVIDMVTSETTNTENQANLIQQGLDYIKVRMDTTPRASLDSASNKIAVEFNYKSTALSAALSNRRKTMASENEKERQKESHLEEATPAEDVRTEVNEDLKVDYHVIPFNELVARYDSDIQNGLTNDQARLRLRRDGPNIIKQRNYFSKIKKVFFYFFGGFGIILWPSAIASILAYKPLGNPDPDKTNLALGIVLFCVILTNAFFNAYQDWESMRVMSAIGQMLPSMAVVIRNGTPIEIPAKNIVVGDILQLNNGNKVPADCRIIECQQLKVDKSILTGESEPISCSVNSTDMNYLETRNLLFMGSSVVEGSGTALVVGTGNETVMGKIYKLSSSGRSSMTPITIEINIFMSIIVFFAVLVIMAISFAYGFWLRKDYPGFLNVSGVVVLIIGAVVGILPEGLPVSITLTFALIAKKMFQHNVLVKNLPTVETLGSVSVIASDKTGTLTQNKMSLLHVFIHASRRFKCGDETRQLYGKDPVFMELLKTACLCNRAVFEEFSNDLPIHERKVVGDASDTALLMFSEDLMRTSEFRSKYKKLAEIPFNSKNKWMLSIYAEPEDSNHAGKVCLLMKGAPEIILEKCGTILMENGQECKLTQELRERIANEQEELSCMGERVLGLSCTYLDPEHYGQQYRFDVEERNFPMENLCFIGLVALIDPPRLDVPDSIRQCNTAGIRVMMVTGDHPSTALSIAKMIGIISNEHVDFITCDKDIQTIISNQNTNKERKRFLRTQSAVVRGSDIPNFSKETWNWLLEYKELVFARTTPEHKLKIIKELQRKKNIVAAIGDGVNDSPALRQSNVGVAMGAGSEIAREAADIVLIENSFSSIVQGIRLGRVAFDNLKKVLIYMLPAGSFSELMPVLSTAFLGLPAPLSSFLMIIICCGTDIFPSLSLIYEQGESDVMHRKPRSVTKDRLVNYRVLSHAYIFLGFLECFSAFGMWFYYMHVYGGFKVGDLFFLFNSYTAGFYGKTQEELNEIMYTAQCVYFVTLVMVQLTGNVVSTRTRRLSYFQHLPFKGPSKNMRIFVFSFLSVCVAMVVIYLPLVNNIFHTRHVPFQFWLIPIGCGLTIFCLDEFRKLIARHVPESIGQWIFW